jgi:hypothetical protein
MGCCEAHVAVVTSVDTCALPSKRPLGKRLNRRLSGEHQSVLLIRRLHVRVVPGVPLESLVA